ncbi:MAG: hypothetical protein RL492_1477 [Verrucomicrobiota bacterium]|jgi:hypothetical protein
MSIPRPFRGQSDELTRRSFIASAAKAFLGVGLLPGVFAGLSAQSESPGGKAKRIIYLYMDGGMSHVDTLDPKQGEVAGPTKSVKSSAAGIRLGEYLSRTAQLMHLGTVVRSLTSNQGAHEQGNYFMHTSYQLRGTISHPSMGAWLSHFKGPGNPSLPASVYIGNASRHPGAGFFPPAHAPLFVNNPENGLRDVVRPAGLAAEAQARRLELAQQLDAPFLAAYGSQRAVAAQSEAYDGAFRMMASKDIEAFDLTREPAALREGYGKNAFGQGCLLARRLAERGVGYVEVGLHGWDTHVNNFVVTPDLCDQLDRGLSALLEDLRSRGMLKDTLVVLATEFGRTPRINTNLGRDHYPKAFSAALFGGGVKAGYAHGSTDATGEEVTEAALGIPDFNATIALALGLPLDQVVYSPSQRPFRLADKGKPVPALLS